MLLLGLLIVAATAAFTGLLIADNTGGGPDYTVTVLGHSIATMNSMAIFLAGVAMTLLFCLGLAMLRGASRRHGRRRSELRTARRETQDAQAERDMLASRMPEGRDGYADPNAEAARGQDPTVADDRGPDPRGSRHRHGRHLFGH